MAKKNNGSADKKTILVIFIEGDTEVDFYNKMVASIREKTVHPSCTVKIKLELMEKYHVQKALLVPINEGPTYYRDCSRTNQWLGSMMAGSDT